MQNVRERLKSFLKLCRANWETTGLILTLVLAIPFIWLIPKYQMVEYRASLDAADVQKLDYKDRIQLQDKLFAVENSARLTVAQSFGGLLVLFSILIAVRNARIAQENARAAQQNAQAAQTNAETALKNLKLTEETSQKNLEHAREGKITDRFSKAVELLGSDKLDTRLGGIYVLERIDRDSQPDHWTVMEVLTAFVREKSRRDYLAYQAAPPSIEDKITDQAIRREQGIEEADKDEFKLATDVQAALTVIGRRKWREQEKPHERLDLSQAYLPKADLSEAHLERASFNKTHLERASLYHTHLTRADLIGAHLKETRFGRARLEAARLRFGIGLVLIQLFDAIIDEETTLPPTLEPYRPQLLERSKKLSEKLRDSSDAK